MLKTVSKLRAELLISWKSSIMVLFQRCRRDHRNKLDLDSLLISPIQRVPRYELIVKVGILIF